MVQNGRLFLLVASLFAPDERRVLLEVDAPVAVPVGQRHVLRHVHGQVRRALVQKGLSEFATRDETVAVPNESCKSEEVNQEL